MTRAGLCVAAAIAASMGIAGVSSGSTSVETYPPVNDPQLPSAGGVFIRGDVLSSQIRVGYDAGADEFLVQDSRRPLKLTSGRPQSEPCQIRGRHIARCPNPERDESSATVTVRLRGGPDFLLPKRSLSTSIAANGGPGVDEVNGARGGDVLKGGPGTDVVRGLDGDDNISGGPGDVLSGGEGDDVILADYGTAERSIDCGAGDDRAFVDSTDPETFGCERVVVR